mmetsp:Transcript_46385/g.68487  ORF Transcript_46385/g.68487 Transcript_46385/m.68487 type:complete len:86 (+) Transcript_46385:153-410(+)
MMSQICQVQHPKHPTKVKKHLHHNSSSSQGATDTSAVSQVVQEPPLPTSNRDTYSSNVPSSYFHHTTSSCDHYDDISTHKFPLRF